MSIPGSHFAVEKTRRCFAFLSFPISNTKNHHQINLVIRNPSIRRRMLKKARELQESEQRKRAEDASITFETLKAGDATHYPKKYDSVAV